MEYSTLCKKCANSSEMRNGGGLTCKCFGFALLDEGDGCCMYSKKKQARLVERGRDERNGGTYEIWDVGNDVGVFVDFNPCPMDTRIPETMAFPMDLRDNEVTSWIEDGVWYEDATGGKAIRELGYEPVEDGDVDDTD